MNETVRDYCAAEKIELTRCRPYRKNDQAHVEQKNGEIVRRMVGYRRYEGIAAAEQLARLYAPVRLFVNAFQPSFKPLRKERDGARVTKRLRAIGCWPMHASPRVRSSVSLLYVPISIRSDCWPRSATPSRRWSRSPTLRTRRASPHRPRRRQCRSTHSSRACARRGRTERFARHRSRSRKQSVAGAAQTRLLR
jgi:hypothetical protein